MKTISEWKMLLLNKELVPFNKMDTDVQKVLKDNHEYVQIGGIGSHKTDYNNTVIPVHRWNADAYRINPLRLDAVLSSIPATSKVELPPIEYSEEAAKAYVVLQKHSGFKAGDRVRVIRAARRNEMGWGFGWNPTKEARIGNVYTIERVDNGYSTGTIVLDTPSIVDCFPFFVLELVEPKPVKSELDVVIESFGEMSEKVRTLIKVLGLHPKV